MVFEETENNHIVVITMMHFILASQVSTQAVTEHSHSESGASCPITARRWLPISKCIPPSLPDSLGLALANLGFLFLLFAFGNLFILFYIQCICIFFLFFFLFAELNFVRWSVINAVKIGFLPLLKIFLCYLVGTRKISQRDSGLSMLWTNLEIEF